MMNKTLGILIEDSLMAPLYDFVGLAEEDRELIRRAAARVLPPEKEFMRWMLLTRLDDCFHDLHMANHAKEMYAGLPPASIKKIKLDEFFDKQRQVNAERIRVLYPELKKLFE